MRIFVVTLAALVLVALLIALDRRPPQWETETSLVVLPSRNLRPVAMTNFYEELNTGQVVKTYAAVLRLRKMQMSAAEKLGLPARRAELIDVSVRVQPGTAVLALKTASPEPGDAEGMATQLVIEAQNYVQGAFRRFAFEVISESPTQASPVPWWRSIPWDRWVESRLQ